MRGVSLLSTLVIVLVLSVGPLMAQLNDAADITGAGARAEGLGGAFIGVADDATSLVWNPAGLVQLERPEASLVFRQIFDGYKYKNSFNSDFNRSKSSKHFAYNFGSLAYPLTLGSLKMTLALAYQQQIDLYIYREGDADQGTVTTSQEGGIYTITPGIGVRLLPMLSVGASANVWSGSSEYREIDPGTGDDVGGYDDEWKSVNFQLGALADFSALENPIPLKLGVSFRTPFDMKDKWDLAVTDGGGKWTWEYPMMLGVGASYRFGENLMLAADYELRPFGKSKIRDDENDAVIDNFSGSKKDLNQFRAGAEYLIVTSSGVFPLRVGFKTNPRLLADITYDNTTNFTELDRSQVKGVAFSLGTGYIHKRFAFDVSATQTSYDWEYKYDDTSDYDRDSFSKLTIALSTIVYF